jgi:hypothetical protein
LAAATVTQVTTVSGDDRGCPTLARQVEAHRRALSAMDAPSEQEAVLRQVRSPDGAYAGQHETSSGFDTTNTVEFRPINAQAGR